MSTTNWACSVNASGNASLTLSTNGSSPENFSLKGLCYSPCPINGSNGYAPAIGDWFWDSYAGTGYDITGWEAMWERDLPNIRALGANTIRVYSMLSRQINDDGSYPNPWNSGTLMTHQTFLDQCWNGGVNPVYVMVGIPLPQAMFWYNIYQQTPQSEINFWTNVLTETVAQMASHPAVIGFIIQNEMDSGTVTWGSNTQAVDFWWSQVELMAQTAQTALGTNQKLVGMAVHDNPYIPGTCQTNMATCTSMDFWGVNSYQTVNFDSVFQANPNIGPGYAGLTGAALKPVIFTEWGLPATGHTNPNDPSTIYADATTIGNTATYITDVAPNAYQQSLCLGLYYFEYCDEWWNQDGSPNIYTWYGGAPDPGFPNGFWDQEGFGLFSQARGKGLANSAAIWQQNGGTGGPATPIDVLTVRDATFTALCTVFNADNFPVDATVAWQDTGFNITSGQTVNITYLAGLWTDNPNDNNGNLYDANGNPQFIAAKTGYTMPGQNEGALIGKIGDTVFLVGDGVTAPAGLTGPLMLCINDDLNGIYGSGLADNLGLVTVQISITS